MKSFKIILLLLFCLAILLGYKGYKSIWGQNLNTLQEDTILYIPPSSKLTDVVDSLTTKDLLLNTNEFILTAKMMRFGDSSLKPGRYDLAKTLTNRAMISKLRLGQQDAVNVIINGGRTIEEVTTNIAEQFTFSADDLLNVLMAQDIMKEWNATPQTLIAKIVPDTYQMYWSSTPEQVADRIHKEYEKYWTNDRLGKAMAVSLTPDEVMTLASIVEKESNKSDEHPIIAGVYLNRLKRGMLLQADPTVVFANGDFTIRRVLNKHLRSKSPYNTYLYAGLPPGPICLPSKSAIDGVLNPEEHKYLYFCAQPNYSGRHDFSKNLVQHNNSANRYRRWLTTQGIRR